MSSPLPSGPPPLPDAAERGNRRFPGLRLVKDALLGLALLAALVLIFVMDARRGPVEPGVRGASPVDAETGDVDESDSATLVGRPLRLAVTPPEYDDMGRLLDSLGEGYRYRTIPYGDFLDAGRLEPYDVVFLTCGGVPRDWLGRRLRDAQRGASAIFSARQEIVDQLHAAIRRFVAQGGTLYVSDFHFDVLAIAFPELVDRSRVGRGIEQTVEAEVLDAGLRHSLGETIPLRFEMRAWRPAAFAGPQVTALLRGTYQTIDGQRVEGPLLVTFPHGDGTVIFTSFHNEAQNSRIETELLHHLVFATVTAREQTHVRRMMVRGGFSPQQRNLLSASSPSEPVTRSYDCARRGPLQFVLGFEDRGARLRLSIVGPNGSRREKTGTKTFRVDVPDAAAGRWQVTVTPLEIPFRHFPFTLTVGQRKESL